MTQRSSSPAQAIPPAPSANAKHPIDHVDLAALEWQVTLWSDQVTPEEQHAFNVWLAADPAHQAAWRRVQNIDQQLAIVPSPIAGSVLRASLPSRSGNTRRNILRGVCLLAGGAVSMHLLRESGHWPALHADYHTARGERQNLTLPDGSLLSMNSASSVDLQFTAQERRILLHSGEVLITTAAHQALPYRPFIVQTGEGSVQALGTQFLLRRLDGTSPAMTSVQVFDGAVDIMPVSSEAVLRLGAGQQARFSRRDTQAPTTANPQDAAWQRGLLVAERQRLEDFLAELSRYRTGVLRCDPAVADLLVSGVYPLEDTDHILASLAQALPVRLQRMTRYWVTVAAT